MPAKRQELTVSPFTVYSITCGHSANHSIMEGDYLIPTYIQYYTTLNIFCNIH